MGGAKCRCVGRTYDTQARKSVYDRTTSLQHAGASLTSPNLLFPRVTVDGSVARLAPVVRALGRRVVALHRGEADVAAIGDANLSAEVFLLRDEKTLGVHQTLDGGAQPA